MTRGELCDLLVAQAKKWRLKMQDQIQLDRHMHSLPEDAMPSQQQIDVVLTVFLNRVAADQWIDLALYERDLLENEHAHN